MLALAALDHLDDGARHVGRALAALGPVVGHHRLDAQLGAGRLDQLDLGLGVGAEAVDRDHRHEAELPHVLDVALQVGHAGLERLQVLGLEVFLLHAAMHLERADGRDEHDRVGRRGPVLRHLMSKNFSPPRSAPKPASVTT